MKLDNNIKKFIIKTSVISSLIVLVLASQIKDFIDCIVSVILDPFFSIDINSNGEADLEELKKMIIQIGKYKFTIGKLLYSLIEIAIKISIIVLFLYLIINYTNLINNNSS